MRVAPRHIQNENRGFLNRLFSFFKKLLLIVAIGAILYLFICNGRNLAINRTPRLGFIPSCRQKCWICKTYCWYACQNPDPVIPVIPQKPLKPKSQNGLILVGDQRYQCYKQKYSYLETQILDEYLQFVYNPQLKPSVNAKQLESFIQNSINFRVVILISEDKLEDDRAIYTRNLIKLLSFIHGIQNFLSYIDILVIERTFSVYITKNLRNLATSDQQFQFEKTPHLLTTLLFNLKNQSITEHNFFKDIQFKKGLSNRYLIQKENQLDIKTQMKKQAQQLLKNLTIIILQMPQTQPKSVMQLYYFVENNQKNKVLSRLNKLLDQRVLAHLSDPHIQALYKSEIKQTIEKLNLNVSANVNEICKPPKFRQQQCQKKFYLIRMNKTKETSK